MATLIHNQIQEIGQRRISVILLLPWMICWLTVFPLIHVHPEADHAHGQTHHHHGGLVHSVFSQDLPCEFGTNSKPSFSEKTHFIGVPTASHTHSHFLTHSEITLSAINQAPDEPLKKQFVESVVLIKQDHSPTYCVKEGNIILPQRSDFSYHITHPYFSRPPPVLTI